MKPTLRTALIVCLLLASFSLLKAQPGTLDSSFGVNGKVTTSFNTSQATHGKSCIMQPDEKIIVVGYVNDYSVTSDFAIARYLSNGNLDSSFGQS